MFHVICEKDRGFGVLDTSDGVVEFVSGDDLKKYRELGICIDERKDLSFCSGLYTELVKRKTLGYNLPIGRDKTAAIKTERDEIWRCFKKLTAATDYFDLPIIREKTEVKLYLEFYPGCIMCHICTRYVSDVWRENLYSITPEGIFWLFQTAFSGPVGYFTDEVLHNPDGTVYDQDAITVTVCRSGTAFLSEDLGVFVTDRRLKIKEVLRFDDDVFYRMDEESSSLYRLTRKEKRDAVCD